MDRVLKKNQASCACTPLAPIGPAGRGKNTLPPVQYAFGDFLLNSSRVLFHKDKRLSISPKELGVLSLLLESAGELVTKAQIIHEVWYGGNVGEESLTRCIYVLRRILQEEKDHRYIDTVYGKGYRFTLPVTRILPARPGMPARCVLAVFPFRLAGDIDTVGLQDAIVQQLAPCSPLGLHVLPTSLTMNCRTTDATLQLLDKIRPDYYLTGYELNLGGAPSLRIELMRAEDHLVLLRERVAKAHLGDEGRFLRTLKPLILGALPGMKAMGLAAGKTAEGEIGQSAMPGQEERKK